MTTTRRMFQTLALTGSALLATGLSAPAALAADASALSQQAQLSLQQLYKTRPGSEALAKNARAILVFPKIIKAGLIFGGAYGEGVLHKGGAVDGYYNSVTASWGWQAGAESYGYVVFLMSDKAVKYLDVSKGWEIGVGPTVVVVNEGVAKNLSSSTLKDDAYAFIFDQQGLMASLSIEGTKISRIKR
jgi:lipid-binding SYLF domain-containing protein